jgi:hypothetical protein
MIYMISGFIRFVKFKASSPHTEGSLIAAGFKVTKEQALGLSKDRKKFDIREEYYVRAALYIGWQCN